MRLRPLIAAVAVVTAVALVPGAAGEVPGAVSITSGPSGWVRSTSAVFQLSAAPEGSTLECRLDDAADFTPCDIDESQTVSYIVSEGEHIFRARATNPEGTGPETTQPWTVDVTSPTLGSLPDLTVEATGPTGAVVTWSLSASDNLDASPQTNCTPKQPGDAFAIGQIDITCTATDAAGNADSEPFSVTVRDTTPPALAEHEPVLAGQQNASGAVVSYELPAATDLVDPSPTVTCNPPPGSTFPIGETTVICRASDAHDNDSPNVSFTVTVQQGAIPGAPAITSHPPVLTNTTSAGFAFTAPDGSAAVRCSLDSATSVDCAGGTAAYSSLAEGGHLFVVEVENSVGNNSNASWNWTIDRTRPQAVGGVRARGRAGRVELSWTRPTDADYRRVRLHRKRVGAATWRFVAGFRRATSYTDGAVRNDVRYRYRLFSFDRAGNRSPASRVTARPSRVFRPAWHAVLSSPPLIDWTAVRTASYYNLQIWRRSTKILSVWPVESRFRMRSTWRFRGRTFSFSTGRYTVYVWPGFGSKAAADYGRLQGWTRFSRG